MKFEYTVLDSCIDLRRTSCAPEALLWWVNNLDY